MDEGLAIFVGGVAVGVFLALAPPALWERRREAKKRRHFLCVLAEEMGVECRFLEPSWLLTCRVDRRIRALGSEESHKRAYRAARRVNPAWEPVNLYGTDGGR